MIQVKGTSQSLRDVRHVFQTNKRAFYSRFGDADKNGLMAPPRRFSEMKKAVRDRHGQHCFSTEYTIISDDGNRYLSQKLESLK